MRLSDAVDSADSLFDLHWIPREIVIDQQIGGLEVQAFGGRIRTNQDIDLSPQEPVLNFLSIDTPKAPCVRIKILAAFSGIRSDEHGGVDFPQTVDKVTEGVIKSRKDNRLLDPAAREFPLLENRQQLVHFKRHF
jgi:hypothetical protein